MNRRVLLLRLDAIGDFILFTSALPHLRQLFRDDKITLVVHPLVAPLANNCPYVDEVWHIDPERYATDSVYVAQVSRHFGGNFDIVVNTMYSRTWQSDDIAARTHAPVKIGFACLDNDGRREIRTQDQALYTTLVASPEEWMFEIERYRLLLNALGMPPDAESLQPVYWIRDEERAWADKYIANTFPDKKFAVLSPGAGFDTKLWSNEYFAAVADWLIGKFGMNVVIAGSAKDKSLAQGIQKLSKQSLYDLTGESSLNQFAALIERASLFVGIDTAGFHFAWTSGIPSVGIFGGGHFDRFTPSVPHARIVHVPMDCYRCYWHCIYDEIKCITSITPEMVKKEIEGVMNVQQVGKQ